MCVCVSIFQQKTKLLNLHYYKLLIFLVNSVYFPLLHVCQVTSVVSDSLRPYGLYPTRLLQFMGFSRQEYWGGLPCPLPGDLPDPGIKPVSLTSPSLGGSFFTSSTTWEAHFPLQTWIIELTLLPFFGTLKLRSK